MKNFKVILFQLCCAVLVILSYGESAHAFLGDWLIGAHEKCQETEMHPSKKVDLSVLIDCFTPDFLGTIDTSAIYGLQQDVDSIREKTELRLYMMNASGKIIKTTTENKNKLGKLTAASITGNWENDELLSDQENSFHLMIALHKALKVDEFYHQACSKERLKDQPYCAQLAMPEYQQNIQLIQQQRELLATQNFLLFDATIKKKIDEFSDLTKEEQKGLVKDRPINPFAGREKQAAFYRQEFPHLLQRANEANEATIKRHQQVLARNKLVEGEKNAKTIVEMEDLLANQKLIYDYLATNYQPQAIFIADKNQGHKVADLSYANCRIVLQNSANDLNDVFTSASLDLAMVAVSFGVAGAARLIIANAPKVAALFTSSVRTSRLMYYGSEGAMAATEAARVFEKGQECAELMEIGVVLPDASTNISEQQKECQSLLQMQTLSYALAALGGGVGIKFSKIDITQFRLERVQKLGKGKLMADMSKAKAVANNPLPGVIPALDPSQAEKAAAELEQIFSDPQLVARLKEIYKNTLSTIPNDEESIKFAVGILALLERKFSKQKPPLDPEQLRNKIMEQFAAETKFCRIN